MIRSIKVTLVTASLLMLLSGAYAGITLNAARIGAEDVEALRRILHTGFRS